MEKEIISSDVSSNSIDTLNFSDHLEHFYICYSSAYTFIQTVNKEEESIDFKQPIIELIISINNLEDYYYMNKSAEVNNEVEIEIIKDCRKKCINIIRSPFADFIRNLISSSRKKLNMKTSLDNDSAQQHGQRHLNTIIELLGKFSNIVVLTVDSGLSSEIVKMTLSPLYSRIIEVAFECFTTFKKDKELDQWSSKLLNSSAEFNLNALDCLITQVSSMREIINQHYLFLYNYLSPIVIRDNNNIDNNNNKNQSYIDLMLLVTQEEFLNWRELESIYVMLEFGYLMRAINEACFETELLEIESGVFVPQSLADIFFLINRTVERAISTGSESCVFAIGNKIVEIIQNNSESHSLVYETVINKSTFINCHNNKKISLKPIDKYLVKTINRQHTIYSNNIPLNNSISSNNNNNSNNNSKSDLTTIIASDESNGLKKVSTKSEIAAELSAAVEIASSITEGVNSWLAGFSNTSNNNNNKSQINTPPSSNNSNNAISSSTKNFNDIIIGVLDLEEAEITTINNYNDFYIQINTISLVVTGIVNLINLFTTITSNNTILSINSSKSSHLQILLSELSLCKTLYNKILSNETSSYVTLIFNKYIRNDFITYSQKKSYNINGEEMDFRSGDNLLLKSVTDCINILFSSEMSSNKMSNRSFHKFIIEFSLYISDKLYEDLIIQNMFSEWGGLLFHEEVLLLIRFLEELIEDFEFLIEFKNVFKKLNIFIKLLSLDAPSDIKKYNISLNDVDDETVKKVMSRRIEFSKEAISNVKIKI